MDRGAAGMCLECLPEYRALLPRTHDLPWPTEQDFKDAIALTPDTAPGEDGLPYALYRMAPDAAASMMLQMSPTWQVVGRRGHCRRGKAVSCGSPSSRSHRHLRICDLWGSLRPSSALSQRCCTGCSISLHCKCSAWFRRACVQHHRPMGGPQDLRLQPGRSAL